MHIGAPGEPQVRRGGYLGSPRKRGFRGVVTAGWSSPVARQAHNLKVVGSNPTPATKHLHNTYTVPFHSPAPSDPEECTRHKGASPRGFRLGRQASADMRH